MLNNFDIACVHIHEWTLLLVIGLPAAEAGLKYSNRIGKLSCVITGFDINTLSFGSINFWVVTLSKFFLKIENFVLKSEFINLVLSFQGKNLVICVLTESLTIIRLQVKLLDIVDGLANLAVETLIYAALIS